MAAGKFYVYHLIDPRSNEVFYVGKGCGSRISQHEIEARKGSDHPKCDVIRAIWDDGHEVKRVKVKTFKDEQDAYDFEATEVERIGLENLTNLQIGGGGARDATNRIEPAYVARMMLKAIAGYLRLSHRGLRISDPWGEVMEHVWPHTIKRIAGQRGKDFVVAELAKHKVEFIWQPA